jgi:hypothetical protein
MCRKVWRESRSAEDFRSLRPAEVVDEAVAQLESVVEELAQLAESTNNDAVRLGAIKARAATLHQRLELLWALGRVPLAPLPGEHRSDRERGARHLRALRAP